MSRAGAATRRKALADAARRLEAAGVDSPRLDAEHLLAHALDLSRRELLPALDLPLHKDEAARFEDLAARRASRVPLQQLLGEWEFYSLTLTMRPGVFIPRPETEILVGETLKALDRHFPGAVLRGLEWGTGSGAIALALAHERLDLKIWASDISEAAVALASENARRLGLADRVFPERLPGLPRGDGMPVHFVISNPPYIALAEKGLLQPEVADHDPPEALFGGEDGLDFYRELARVAPPRLLPEGLLALEIGDSQAAAVVEILETEGWRNIEGLVDLSGRDRGILACWS